MRKIWKKKQRIQKLIKSSDQPSTSNEVKACPVATAIPSVYSENVILYTFYAV
jgi:hypothetical protein